MLGGISYRALKKIRSWSQKSIKSCQSYETNLPIFWLSLFCVVDLYQDFLISSVYQGVSRNEYKVDTILKRVKLESYNFKDFFFLQNQFIFHLTMQNITLNSTYNGATLDMKNLKTNFFQNICKKHIFLFFQLTPQRVIFLIVW